MRLTRAPGFTLIEVLVTLVIAALGLLSAAALQAMSKKLGYDAVQRTQATALAQQILERMRANTAGLASYPVEDASAIELGTDCGAADARCDPATMAAYDHAQWARLLRGETTLAEDESAVGGLVAPTGCIRGDAVSGRFTIAVAWRGLTPLDQTPEDENDPVADPCGQGEGRYDDPATPGEDERLRRILVIEALISDPFAA
ncbi:MAG TPA: type IV pilus modification protein PilV [Nevskiaceae bacterium]|nr:type IV pilus modification protein PilV [Nevskiaceae bacterium]